jgi:hypothetical protein
MATVSKMMLGAVIAAVSIASPAFAQYASRSDPSISAQHSKYAKKSSHRNGYDAFGTVPAVYDPAGQPYPAVDRNVPLFNRSFGGQ